MEYILTFGTTNHSIKSEQYLLKAQINVKIMPLPPQIRAGCGLCLRVSQEEIEQAIHVLLENNISEFELFLKTNERDEIKFTKIEMESLDWKR